MTLDWNFRNCNRLHRIVIDYNYLGLCLLIAILYSIRTRSLSSFHSVLSLFNPQKPLFFSLKSLFSSYFTSILNLFIKTYSKYTLNTLYYLKLSLNLPLSLSTSTMVELGSWRRRNRGTNSHSHPYLLPKDGSDDSFMSSGAP